MGEIADALRRAGRSDPRSAEPPIAEKGPARVQPDRRVVENPASSTQVPSDRLEGWQPRAVAVEQEGPVAESFRHLALRLQRELPPRLRSLAIVSAMRSEGKTTIASNLALALASLSSARDIALVDLDLRRPSLRDVLNLSPTVGIDDVLASGENLRGACHSIDAPRLDVYPVRVARERAHEILLGGPLKHLLRELEQRYRLVIVDTPPVVLVPDTQIIVQHLGASLAVARYRQSRLNAFSSMLDHLPPGHLVGAIWNEGKLVTGSDGYYYYRTSETQIAS